MKKTTDLDAEFCGRVPLHQTNQIQPHGVLLIVARESWQVIQASENVAVLLKKEAREVVGQPLTDFIAPADRELLSSRMEQLQTGKIPFSFTLPTGLHIASIQVQEQYLIIELESEPSQPS